MNLWEVILSLRYYMLIQKNCGLGVYYMIKKSFVWISEYGMHARPAGKLVSIASQFKSNIVLEAPSSSTDAKGLFGLMGLKLKKGDTITLQTEGLDEAKAQDFISKFLTQGLAEEVPSKN